MMKKPEALWLSVSPALRGFNRPILNTISRQMAIAEWRYHQTIDEPMCLETALVLLHDYLKDQNQPLHLIGHGTSGLVGLLYARRHPERVRSLTLLSVAPYPAVDWQAHYYVQLHLLPCCRETLLTQMVYTLFGHQSRPIAKRFLSILDQDLQTSLSPHTLYKRTHIAPVQLSLPLLVCGAQDDVIIDPNLLNGWRSHLEQPNPSSAAQDIWRCPSGRYFFHYFYPEQTQQRILKFWQNVSHPQTALVSI